MTFLAYVVSKVEDQKLRPGYHFESRINCKVNDGPLALARFREAKIHDAKLELVVKTAIARGEIELAWA
mgnify:CR=1 FL=1